MIIPICNKDKDTGLNEWILLEIQGNLIKDGEIPTNSIHLGNLKLYDNTTATLRISHNILDGKIINIPKPFAVIKRNKDRIIVQGIARQKILFCTRPRPQVNN